jgi:CopG family transcriptional regulator / antitoxin EndoAI
MAKRINISLPETTISTIDSLVKKGERSRLIDRAVQHYVATRTAEGLREQLKAAAIRDRDIDSDVALDWAAVDNE